VVVREWRKTTRMGDGRDVARAGHGQPGGAFGSGWCAMRGFQAPGSRRWPRG